MHDLGNQTKAQIFGSVAEAPRYGSETTALHLAKFNIVSNATKDGKCSVDVVLIDENGDKYLAMITGDLLSTIGQMAKEINDGRTV